MHIDDLTDETRKYYIDAGWVDEHGYLMSCCGTSVQDDGRCNECKENCV